MVEWREMEWKEGPQEKGQEVTKLMAFQVEEQSGKKKAMITLSLIHI